MVESFDKCYHISRAEELLNVTWPAYRSALDMERGGGGEGEGGSRYTGEEDSMLPNPLYYTNSSPYP